MAASLFTDLHGQPITDNEALGYGRSGVVIHRGNLATKIPLRHPWSSDYDVELNIEVLQHEQEVYRRFISFESSQIDGVVPCIELCTNATQLAYMENGDLRTYLTKKKPSRAAQAVWFQQMARALDQVHGKCVLVADIATRNFLLESDLSIRLCDLSEASALPLGTAMEAADDGGFSIQTDIGQLGSVIYEVVTGQACGFDLFKHNAPDDSRAAWPQRSDLPSTDGLWLGSIIEKCWTKGGFPNAKCLLQALSEFNVENENVSEENPSLDGQKPRTRSPWSLQCLSAPKAFTMLAFSLGALTIAVTWARRQPRT